MSTEPIRRAPVRVGLERLRLLLDGATDHGIFMLGPQGMVLTWNGGAQRSFGWSAEEVIGQPVSILYPVDHDGAVHDGAVHDGAVHDGAVHASAALAAAIEEGRCEKEAWLVRKDSGRFWAEVVITPLRDRAGRVRGFAMVVRDLSERLWGQELHAVLDAASDAILGVDANGRVIFANSAARTVFGYPASDLVGVELSRLLPAGAAALDQNLSGEFVARRQDTSAFPAEVSSSTVETPRGRMMTVTVRDLTERRRQAEALRLSEERLRALVAYSPVGQFEATVDGVIAWTNPALETLLAAAPADLEGRHWADLLPAEQVTSFLADLRALRLGAADSYSGEQVLRGLDGRQVPVLAAASVVRDSAGRPVRLVGTVVDNTARDTARRELERSRTQLAISQRMVGLGSWEQDTESGAVIWSEELYRLVGLSPGRTRITYDTFFDYVQPVDKEAIESAAHTAARTGGTYCLDVDILRTDGERRTVSLRRELDESGPVPLLRGTILDVTEARALERALRSTKDVFAGILAASTDTAIIGTDASGHRITFINAGAERLLGWSADELLGTSPMRLHDPAELAALSEELGVGPDADPMRVLVERGVAESPREWTYLIRDGSRRRVRLTLAVLGEPGSPTGYVGVAVPLPENRPRPTGRTPPRRRAPQARLPTAPMSPR